MPCLLYTSRKLRNVPFSPPDMTEAEITEVANALRSGWITTGPRTKEFERLISMCCQTDVYKRQEIYSMLGFSIPVALQESLYTIVHWIGLLLLIHFANYGEVGLSSAAALWQSVVIFVPAMLKNVMFSYLSSSDNHSDVYKRQILTKLQGE